MPGGSTFIDKPVDICRQTCLHLSTILLTFVSKLIEVRHYLKTGAYLLCGSRYELCNWVWFPLLHLRSLCWMFADNHKNNDCG